MADAKTAPLRVGIAGTGWSASQHADALRRLPSVVLHSIAGGDERRAQEAAHRIGARRFHASPEALVEDPAIDAVHVCTVNATHAPLARAALNAGKHVLCEKPLGVSTAETAELAALAADAAERGVISGVCFNYRHYGIVGHLREALHRGDFGPPHMVHGGYLQDWLLRAGDWSWRLETEAGGRSRAFADIGSHWADLAQHVLGSPVVEVMADLTTLYPERRRPLRARETFAAGDADGVETEPVPVETEDFGSVLVRFGNGARGSFVVSQASAGRKNQLTLKVDCRDAAVEWAQEQPERLWIGRRGAPNLDLMRDPSEMEAPPSAAPALPAGHPEGWRDALRGLLDEFYGAVLAARDGERRPSSFATFADGHRGVLLIDAIVASHEQRAWVSVPEAGAGA